jgi:2-keto-3-deoxy-L-rhamnonate aldolase RhmA
MGGAATRTSHRRPGDYPAARDDVSSAAARKSALQRQPDLILTYASGGVAAAFEENTMHVNRGRRPGSAVAASAAALPAALLLLAALGHAQGPAPGKYYNTVKQKLIEGRQVVGGTVMINNPEIYCAMASSGFDFLWIEMQHSPLSYQDVAHMVGACRTATAIPFIRVPDATEGDIQKATDLGALGIIVPMVDTVEKAQNAVRFAKYPPVGRRSQGSGQYGALWGNTYRQTANDNVMIVAMIENPAGVAIADKIAAVPGIDVVFVAATDLTSFSGFRQGDAKYEALVTRVLEATQKAGLKVGGPAAWKDTRQGYSFFQAGDEVGFIRSGVRQSLGTGPQPGGRRGVAPLEGSADGK